MLGLGLSLWQPAVYGGASAVSGAAWAARVTENGGTYNSTTLDAVTALANDLVLFGLADKLLYFNPRCGSDILAARTPLIPGDANTLDTVASGTFAAWNEANGLLDSSSGVMDLGITTDFMGSNLNSISMGMYFLNDVSDANARVMQSSDASIFPGLMPRWVDLTFLDYGGHRVQTPTLTDTSTKGLVIGVKSSSTTGEIWRNGVLRGSTFSTNAGITNVSGSMRLHSARGTSGSDFIGRALTADDAANLTWILHEFNTALGRQVEAEGLD